HWASSLRPNGRHVLRMRGRAPARLRSDLPGAARRTPEPRVAFRRRGAGMAGTPRAEVVMEGPREGPSEIRTDRRDYSPRSVGISSLAEPRSAAVDAGFPPVCSRRRRWLAMPPL